MKTVNRLGGFAAALLLTDLVASAEPGQPTAAMWKPIEQPQLAAAWAGAPALKFEELADGPDVCTEGPMWWVPNPDGKSWDMVFTYYPAYNGRNQVFIYDTGTQELKKSVCPEFVTEDVGFHLNHFFMINGKAYVGPTRLFIYDPARNEFEYGGFPMGKTGAHAIRFEGSLIVPNDDGTLFVGFGPMVSNRNRLAFFTIDPVTLKGDFLGTVGPDNPNFAWEYRGVVCDGDWIYARVGTTPWRLYGMNIKTRQGKVLAETERIIGDRTTIGFIRNENYAGVYVSITGLKGGPKDKRQAFWLRDGELTPCDVAKPNTMPVSPRAGDKLATPRPDFDGYQSQFKGPPKGMEVRQGSASVDGKVRVWYRLAPTGEWQKIDFQVEFAPQPIRRMAALSNGSIFAVGESYGRAVMFNPKTRARATLGGTMSVYSLLPFGDKLYICGYPSSDLWIYDPAKPWTAGQSLDVPPTDSNAGKRPTADTNPASLGYLKDFTDVHIPWASAAGADGRIYFGGKVVRIGNGGGLGWWDTRERKAGGIHEPFDAYTIFWMCSAAEGRYILCSTKPVAGAKNPDYTPPRGRLFVYDTSRHEIIHPVDDERLSPFPGYITEALPGLVMGCTATKDGGLLYGFDPAAGKVIWTKPLPQAPITAFSAMKRGRYFFGKGPDGFIWATIGGTLVRIDPHTAEVLPVGKMEDNPLVFLDGDIYVAGAAKFRKIMGVSSTLAGHRNEK